MPKLARVVPLLVKSIYFTLYLNDFKVMQKYDSNKSRQSIRASQSYFCDLG
jgi:hypothetical protein